MYRPTHRTRRFRTLAWARLWTGSALLLLAVVWMPVAVAQDRSPARYEAEAGTLADGAESKSEPTASGGLLVQLGKAGSIAWRVNAPADGRYELIFRYRTGPADRAEKLSINGVERGIGFAMSDVEWAEARTVRHLRSGENEVVLRADWGQIDIDLLRFDTRPRGRIGPLFEYPRIAPRRSAHYRANSGPVLLLEPGSYRLQRVAGPNGAIPFDVTPNAHLDDAVFLKLDPRALDHLPDGTSRLTMQFDQGLAIPFDLEVADAPADMPWTIYTLNVQHGTAVVMRTPSGKIALIDTATAERAESVLVPFLRQLGIKLIDFLFITHYHEDHAGGLPQIEREFQVGRKWDYNNLNVHDKLDIDGVTTTVLNSKESGDNENAQSLALRMEYNGFVYLHGGDNYGQNQEKQLELFARDQLRANLFHANHHFHGSVDVDFCRAVDPELVVVSAQQAVYARGAFMSIYKEKVEHYLKSVDARLRETLLTAEVGHVIVRIRSGRDWASETAADLSGIKAR